MSWAMCFKNANQFSLFFGSIWFFECYEILKEKSSFWSRYFLIQTEKFFKVFVCFQRCEVSILSNKLVLLTSLTNIPVVFVIIVIILLYCWLPTCTKYSDQAMSIETIHGHVKFLQKLANMSCDTTSAMFSM